MGTLFPCVPAAFQQWERRSHAFPFEMTPANHLVIVVNCPVSAAAEDVKSGSLPAHAAHPLSPMSGREFDPLLANQKPPTQPAGSTFDEAAQQKVLSSFGVTASDGERW